MNRWILARNCSLEAKLLRRSSLRTRMENQISIWLSQEACLGVKWKTMRWVGSRRNASRVFLEASTPDLPLTPSVRLRPQWRATNRTTDSGEVDIEVVADDVPSRAGGGAAQQVVEKSCEVVLAAGVADHALDLAGGDVEGGDQHLSAMTAVFELMPLELAGHHGQVWRDPLQGLDAGLLVDGHRAVGLIGVGRSLVDRADISALGIKGRIGLGGQPVAASSKGSTTRSG
jgi:hypothetical protein